MVRQTALLICVCTIQSARTTDETREGLTGVMVPSPNIPSMMPFALLSPEGGLLLSGGEVG